MTKTKRNGARSPERHSGGRDERLIPRCECHGGGVIAQIVHDVLHDWSATKRALTLLIVVLGIIAFTLWAIRVDISVGIFQIVRH